MNHPNPDLPRDEASKPINIESKTDKNSKNSNPNPFPFDIVNQL